MHATVARYAIYFAPFPDGRLWEFGSRTIGFDAARNAEIDVHPELSAVIPDWRARVAEPARYGFHATLKAPFELQQPACEADLLAAVHALAASLDPVALGHLQIAAMGPFLALVTMSQVPGLERLERRVVQGLDRLRAPLTVEDRARRRPESLSPRQREHLEAWGYPFVLEDFRFHMTLTGPLDATTRQLAQPVLQRLYASVDAPVVVDSLAVFRQDARSAPFRIVSRSPLAS